MESENVSTRSGRTRGVVGLPQMCGGRMMYSSFPLSGPLADGDLMADLTFEVVGDVFACTEVRIKAEPGRWVTATSLRELRLDDMAERLYEEYSMDAEERDDGMIVGHVIDDEAARARARGARAAGRKRGYPPEFLAKVAETYKSHEHGTKAVAERWNVARRTARLYVAKARDSGLIEDGDKP